MNKIDVLLNSIANKHLAIEVLGPVNGNQGRPPSLNNVRLHSALRAAFEGGVRHAGIQGGGAATLFREVDIDLTTLERLPRRFVT